MESFSGLALVVEDEAVLALFVAEVLEGAGWRVLGPAASSAEALGLLADASPDLAVLDVRLRRGNALPVAEALASRGVPFLFATAAEPFELTAAFQDRPVLRKPFQGRDLLAAVAALRPGAQRRRPWPGAAAA